MTATTRAAFAACLLAGGVAGYGGLRSPASCLHDGGHLDALRPGEVLRHADPASVA